MSRIIYDGRIDGEFEGFDDEIRQTAHIGFKININTGTITHIIHQQL